ncbi:hypothetical protein EK21DRAFT_115207 [Setomelanomma holmii]|uniref:Uncharacterized protein n=1 Tax=Setomelanomma holmii TaxID=210430 RepID=A0A9P4LKI9_9PLEO|nr:hypothetical protein EK21DRAFT_115207 [Setomelanomma holmii]
MLDTTLALLHRSAAAALTTTLNPRAPKKSKSKFKSKKVKVGSGSIENWKLALIIIGSIIAACLLAYAACWFYKRRQAKKRLVGDEEKLKPEVNGPGEERGSLEYTVAGAGAGGVGRYEDGHTRRDE